MSFDTANMAEALADTSNDKPQATGPPKDQEAFDTARAKGWVAPVAYDYETKTSSQAIATGADPTIPHETFIEPQWAHLAQKYEWKEEYGDVGPKMPELEAQLFHNDFLTRRGTHMAEYGVKVSRRLHHTDLYQAYRNQGYRRVYREASSHQGLQVSWSSPRHGGQHRPLPV